MKKVRFWCMAILIFLITVSCGASKSFSVKMAEVHALTEPITLTVTLPDNPVTRDITFTVGDMVYTISSLPTVDDPTFVFADVEDDGMILVSLTLADNVSGNAELHMMPETGNERVYTAQMESFSRLTDFLRTN